MTENNEPTPGPWSMRDAVDFSGDIAIIADHKIIAECYSALAHHAERNPAVHANARLIAAAPDLLEALVALYDACELEANRRGGDFGPIVGPAAEQADAAIARAKGEQP